jgi:hypothetical protein
MVNCMNKTNKNLIHLKLFCNKCTAYIAYFCYEIKLKLLHETAHFNRCSSFYDASSEPHNKHQYV